MNFRKVLRSVVDLRTKFALALVTVVFVSLSAGFILAVDTGPRAGSAMAASATGQGGPGAPEQEEHGLSQKALEIARPFGFPITNSMIVCWIVAVGLIIFAQVATRHMKPVPERFTG